MSKLRAGKEHWFKNNTKALLTKKSSTLIAGSPWVTATLFYPEEKLSKITQCIELINSLQYTLQNSLQYAAIKFGTIDFAVFKLVKTD